jgi:hypothetical protein
MIRNLISFVRFIYEIKKYLIMKGITSHVMVIMFSLIIMVVLLVVGIGFVQNYTNIPFEKLWELTPQSSIATEPGFVSGDTGKLGGISTTPHIFTSENNWDLSEIACHIGKVIYEDYSMHGDGGPRTGIDNGKFDHGQPFGAQKGYLVGSGKFFYTGTASKNDADETAMHSYDPACHLCTNSPPPPNGFPPPGAVGITNLDETCINLQFRDRTFGAQAFCSGSFASNKGGYNGKFGDNDCGADRNPGQVGWTGLCNDFCDNGLNKVTWVADHDQDSTDWNITDWGIPEGDNSEILTPSRYYIYGVVWSANSKYYNVLFAEIPNFSAADTPETDWNTMLDPYFQYLPPGTDQFRRGILGQVYPETRIVADYILTPTQPITSIYSQIMIGDGTIHGLANIAFNGLTQAQALAKIVFRTCSAADKSNPTECIPAWTSTEGDKCWTVGGSTFGLLKQNNEGIIVVVDAKDGSGQQIASPNQDLPIGYSYRIIVQQWYRAWDHLDFYSIWYHCYDEYVRSISIIQIPTVSCTCWGPCAPPTTLACNPVAGLCCI